MFLLAMVYLAGMASGAITIVLWAAIHLNRQREFPRPDTPFHRRGVQR